MRQKETQSERSEHLVEFEKKTLELDKEIKGKTETYSKLKASEAKTLQQIEDVEHWQSRSSKEEIWARF